MTSQENSEEQVGTMLQFCLPLGKGEFAGTLRIHPNMQIFTLEVLSKSTLTHVDIEKIFYEIAHMYAIETNTEKELIGAKKLWT